MSDPIIEGAKAFINSFNILGMGIVVLWIIGSLFVSAIVGEKKDEKIILAVLLNACGGILLFANDPSQFVILVVVIVIVLFGIFKLLWSKKE